MGFKDGSTIQSRGNKKQSDMRDEKKQIKLLLAGIRKREEKRQKVTSLAETQLLMVEQMMQETYTPGAGSLIEERFYMLYISSANSAANKQRPLKNENSKKSPWTSCQTFGPNGPLSNGTQSSGSITI